MHIIIVTADMCAGGAQRVISVLLKEWIKKGVQCTLILLNKKPIFYNISKDVDVIEIENFSANHLVDKYKKLKKIKKIVKFKKPDIVLSMPEEIGIYVVATLAASKIPVVVSERNNPWIMPNKPITRFFRKMFYPFASGFIFQTKEASSFFSKRIQTKGVVLDNPLDLDLIPSRYIGSREKVVVSIGRLEKQKNTKLLIDSFSLFVKNHPDFRLSIYGDGKLKSELEEYANKVLPVGSFSFKGNCQNAILDSNKAMMYVMTSNYEGVPNSLIEAMASGIPCISTDFKPCGARIIIDDCNNGFVVPCGDVEALACSMNKICLPDTNMAFSEKSILVKRRFDSAIVSEQWLNYLKKVSRCLE